MVGPTRGGAPRKPESDAPGTMIPAGRLGAAAAFIRGQRRLCAPRRSSRAASGCAGRPRPWSVARSSWARSRRPSRRRGAASPASASRASRESARAGCSSRPPESPAAHGFGVASVSADEEIRGPFLLARGLFASESLREGASEAVVEALDRTCRQLSGVDDTGLTGLAPEDRLLRVIDQATISPADGGPRTAHRAAPRRPPMGRPGQPAAPPLCHPDAAVPADVLRDRDPARGIGAHPGAGDAARGHGPDGRREAPSGQPLPPDRHRGAPPPVPRRPGRVADGRRDPDPGRRRAVRRRRARPDVPRGRSAADRRRLLDDRAQGRPARSVERSHAGPAACRAPEGRHARRACRGRDPRPNLPVRRRVRDPRAARSVRLHGGRHRRDAGAGRGRRAADGGRGSEASGADFTFSHEQVHDFAAGWLPPARRRAIHAAIVDLLAPATRPTRRRCPLAATRWRPAAGRRRRAIRSRPRGGPLRPTRPKRPCGSSRTRWLSCRPASRASRCCGSATTRSTCCAGSTTGSRA